jgi:two-component system nitrate/nitrite response regulator NarL
MRESVNDHRVRVVVGDDHPLFREGAVRALVASGQIQVVGEASDGEQALELINALRPDVALLDLRMPGLDGAQVAAALLRQGVPTRVLLLSAYTESEVVYQALQLGAAGYLPKESSRAQIVAAVLDCAAGKDVLATDLASGPRRPARR